MKLKSIRAYGFKSFADKIDIELKTNITAIVGPNGSGKSNIVDAVRWVLGEQSVKNLRGSSLMSDIIFAGSETRSPLKRAEVALTFDNTDHFLNTDLTDVEVKRILYANGENEYYINNAKVRLKDITNLFLDSGIGVDAFNIISQGSIETIVNSRPIDRRVILESASKVLKYKTRKQESVKKLEKTKDNLEKITLVTDELENTVKPLKEQSIVAKKYLAYQEELESLEISLTTYEITMMHETYEKLTKEIENLKQKKESLEFTTYKESSTQESLRLEQIELDEQISALNEKLIKINESLSKLASSKTILQERQNYVVDEEKIKESLLRLHEQEMAFQKEYVLITDDLNQMTEERKKLTQELAEEEEKQSLSSIQWKHLEAEIEKTNQNHFYLENKIRMLETSIEEDISLPSSVKNVLHNPRLKGIHGTIGKLLEVPEKFAIAIDIALASATNFIVVDKEEDAKEAIQYLKNNNLGRATFFPIATISSRYIIDEEQKKMKSEPGWIGIASDLIEYDTKYDSIMKNQLGNVIVVKDMDSMTNLGKITHYKYRIVSLDGEMMYAGGSLTGGSIKTKNTMIKEKQELANTKLELENNEISLTSLEKKKEIMKKEKEELSTKIEELQKQLWKKEEMEEQKKREQNLVETKWNEAKEQLKGAETLQEGSIEAEMLNLLEEQKNEEIEKEKCLKSIDQLRSRKSEIASSIALLDKEYKDKNAEYHALENELKSQEIELGKLDTKLDYAFQILSDEYHMTYEKAHNEYFLDIDVELARMKVTSLKKSMKDLGEVNIGSIKEYERVNERYTFLQDQKKDLEHAIEELYQMIAEMDHIMEERLKTSFEKIQKEFEFTFRKMFKGGTGILKLTDPDNILETGIEIIAEPPGKKLNNIQLLSGGEKTLTAIALLFAILNAYPVPFCILDEVEAALDEANVDTFGSYLQEQEEKSEFILITHKKRTMEYASTLYGITMQEQGVSKIVSVALEDKVA